MLLGGQPRLTEEPKKSRAQHGQKGEYSNVPKVRTMKTLVAVAILAMVIVPPALAKAKRAQSAPQQGYQSSERPGYYQGYRLEDWYRDSLSSY